MRIINRWLKQNTFIVNLLGTHWKLGNLTNVIAASCKLRIYTQVHQNPHLVLTEDTISCAGTAPFSSLLRQNPCERSLGSGR